MAKRKRAGPADAGGTDFPRATKKPPAAAYIVHIIHAHTVAEGREWAHIIDEEFECAGPGFGERTIDYAMQGLVEWEIVRRRDFYDAQGHPRGFEYALGLPEPTGRDRSPPPEEAETQNAAKPGPPARPRSPREKAYPDDFPRTHSTMNGPGAQYLAPQTRQNRHEKESMHPSPGVAAPAEEGHDEEQGA
jgi:hypothetical protein